VIENEDGTVKELHCTMDKDTLGGKKPADGKKIKGFMHWLSADTAQSITVRAYDRLFNIPNPGAAEDWHDALNPDSLTIYDNAKGEPALADAQPEDRFQFTRTGYYCADRFDHTPNEKLVFNCITPLRSTWDKKA
jgi:glutaminyl-tRNA synthetase